MLEKLNKLPSWINKNMPKYEGVDFVAKPIDSSFNDKTTLTVEVKEDGNDICVYKCNIDFLADKWLGFYLLVVIWNTEYKPKSSMGNLIIEHFTKSIKEFCNDEMPSIENRFFTSGNLTVQKGGKPFFNKLNWNIVELSNLDVKDSSLLEALTQVEHSISKAIPATNNILDAEPSNISFAFLEF